MNIDIAAISAAPQADNVCASADTPAGALDLFAALLDEAAGTTGDPSVPSSGVGEHATDEDDMFDDLAALAMTSLLSLGTPIAEPSDATRKDETAAPTEIGDDDTGDDSAANATAIADPTVIADVTTLPVLVDVSVQSQQTPVVIE